MGDDLKSRLSIFVFILLFFLSSCDLLNSQNKLSIIIVESDAQQQVSVSTGSSVRQVLDSAGIALNPLDKINPPSTTILTEDATIQITRVKEDFLIEQVIVPFEQQTVKNESLAEGQSVLIQAGANGLQQNTWRIIYENGIETSRSFVSSEITQPAKPEIIMLGVQSPFTPQTITGTIAYLSSSNAWIMQGSTSNRRLIVSTGDLDGRIFSLSPDRNWLLFSRTSEKEGEINSLWLVRLNTDQPEPISTGITNVVNYAGWVPGRSRTISFSTVEPVPTAPGWNANNDFLIYRFDEDGKGIETNLIVDKNGGGISGWWGSIYAWSNNGNKVAYSRPDSIGLVDIEKGELISLIDFEPYNTGSDWAWVPEINWAPDDQAIFTTLIPFTSNGSSQNPGLAAILINSQKVVNLVNNCGLFCSPIPSPLSEEGRYQIAFLGAILPDQSETSRYNLKLMDRDGSNQQKFYPGEGIQGLSPQLIQWSPSFVEDQLQAVLAQGNLLLINTETGAIKQITGDSSISKIDWK